MRVLEDHKYVQAWISNNVISFHTSPSNLGRVGALSGNKGDFCQKLTISAS